MLKSASAAGNGAQAEMADFFYSREARRDLLVQVPRHGDRRGTFALRSPVRPNPIAMSVVRLIRIDGTKLIVVGLELEIGWLPPLINQSTNPKIQVGAPGYLDASRFARILEIPTGQVTRAEGDVHPLGNPHYWLDPENGLRIAKGIADKLSEMRPGDAAYFAQRFTDFEQRLKQADQRWLAEMKPYEGRKIVTYHRSWPNFAEHFHLNVVGYVEPRPGIPPSPQHTVELIQQMKRDNVNVIVVEPYFDLKTPNAVARETGGKVLVLPPSVGGEKEITDYFKLFDYDISKLKQAFDATH